MSTVTFNVTLFRTAFPAFANVTTFPTVLLEMYWDQATAFISDNYPQACNGPNLKQQTLSLNLMTAHIAQLGVLAASGGQGGVVVGATIDKVSVQLSPPPDKNQWQWWLNQTPYGAQLLALLLNVGVGGGYFGGWPTSGTVRR